MIVGTFERDGLIAGDYPLKVEEVTMYGTDAGEPTKFKRGDVVALIDGENGEMPALVEFGSTTSGGSKVVGILTENVTVDPGQFAVTTMFIKGEFNRRFLRFGGNDTYEKHKRRMTEIGLLIRETRI